jgi:uncharacterized protein (DUF1501 family)
MKPNLLNRRQFLGQTGCAALGTTGLFSTLLNLGLASRVMAADQSDYKAMICIFLLGGNDSYNMVAPTNPDEYAYYLTTRGGLYDLEKTPAGMAIGAPGSGAFSFLPIQPANIPGRSFGIHPRMPEFKDLFDKQKLAFVANVGSMQKPFANVAAYKNGTNDHPLGLFSHSDQEQQWQTCMPDKRSSIGWAGRAMDILQNTQSHAQKSTFNISLCGTNIFQTGNSIAPYSISVNGLVPLSGYHPGTPTSNSLANQVSYTRSQALNQLLGGLYQNVFESTYAQATVDAQNSLTQYQDSLHTDHYPSWTPDKNASEFESQLKLIANVIAAYKDSPTKRQTFFITLKKYDMHKGLMTDHPVELAKLSSAIGKFWANLSDDVKPAVTMFSASDFGRTLTGNGSGTDHGWGGNQFVLGGAVKGNNIYGTYPTFASDFMNSTFDIGQGRLIPSYSVEEYVYPILKWFGVSDSDLFGAVFPGYATRFGTGGIRTTYPLYG